MKKKAVIIVSGVAVFIILTSCLLYVDEKTFANSKEFSLFFEAYYCLKSGYVEEITDNKGAIYGAIKGMTDSLNDSHTTFFTPDEAKKFIKEEAENKFFGIGVIMSLDNKNCGCDLVIKSIISEQAPAFKAGLKNGDRILKVNGKSTNSVPIYDVVKSIRGDEGTKVILTIYRDEWGEERDVSVTRGAIWIPIVESKSFAYNGEMKDKGDIAYIKINSFHALSPQMFAIEAGEVITSHKKGLVLDLRNNPGGSLEATIDIVSWFVEKDKVIIRLKSRNAKEEVLKSYGPALLKNIPMVVIINGGSASASEVLAAALKENNGVTLIGEKSYGKGTAQRIMPLTDGSMLKFTTDHWLTPNGNQIDKKGIEPDVPVSLEDDPIKKAIEIIVNKINVS